MSSGQRGEFTQENEEATLYAAVLGIPLACFAGWAIVGKYIYAYERIVVYWLLSLGGLIPTDWPVWGWITRQYLFFRYTDVAEIGYLDHAFVDSLIVNSVLLIPILVIVIRKSMFISEKHPFKLFARQLNLYDFMFQQMELYPHLRLMWKLRLLARPLDVGLFRMSDSAKKFCVNNGLVSLPFAKGEPVISEDKAEKVFRSHLGRMMPYLTDDKKADAANLIAMLDSNEKAILAATLPRLAACDEEASDEVYKTGLKVSAKLVNQFWVGFDSYKPQLPSAKDDPHAPLNPPPPPVDTTGCDEVLMEYLQANIVRSSMQRHAYIRTFIYDAIQACRKVGKFPPSDLRWLMMYDRTLWLAVSSAGRREPFWECAGIHAHYLYERKLGKAHERPEVKEAVFALVDELENRMVYTDKEKQEILQMQDEATTKSARLITADRERRARAAEHKK